MKPNISASLLLARAMAQDSEGKEKETIALYRAAIRGGLKVKSLHAALIRLGAALQATGDLKGSIRVLQRARGYFPRDVAVMLHLALAHWRVGQQELAIRQLGDALLKASKQKSLQPYRKALARSFHSVR